MKKLTRIFALLLAVLLTMAGCGASNQPEAGAAEGTEQENTAAPEMEEELDREIDVNLEGYYQIGGVISRTELDLDGNPVEST